MFFIVAETLQPGPTHTKKNLIDIIWKQHFQRSFWTSNISAECKARIDEWSSLFNKEEELVSSWMLTSRQPHKVTAGEKKRKELKSGQCDVTLSKHDRCQTKIGNADFLWFFFLIPNQCENRNAGRITDRIKKTKCLHFVFSLWSFIYRFTEQFDTQQPGEWRLKLTTLISCSVDIAFRNWNSRAKLRRIKNTNRGLSHDLQVA